ncbi:MAG: anaerobic ribonucleoside-triphosphate reductase activating protein [Acidaminococcales bacterium]|jgi:anaerobic ribonucleoside-triphosphate reductase activating protein|nr:anaerobic ribonucleoside-triphosphate reductase activating protein [Acidaminococcales bacterium]
MLRIGSILDESVVDGTGIRLVVFFQGCGHLCKGCHNPALLNFDGGALYAEEELGDIIIGKLTRLHRGVTLSGGDPLFQAEGAARLIDYLRRRKPGLNIWLYTGFEYEKVKDCPAVRTVDVLVDGPFVEEKKDLFLPFRGSANQRIIEMHPTLANGRIVEHKTRFAV